MSRRRNPLPDLSDGEVLRMAARLAAQSAKRELAARLHAIARRVPLWTGRAP